MAEQQRYVRPTIGGWLRPLAFGTFLATYAAVVVYAFAFNVGFIGPWIALGMGLAIGTAWSSVYALMLAGIDLALLVVRVRRLPVGWGAWASAAGSACAVHAIYGIIKPYSFYKLGVWGVVGALMGPMIAAALMARLVWGKRV
jgi:hypothetical protein